MRPRVRSAEGSTTLLEDELNALRQAGATGFVSLLGPPGSGKTTALEHLAAVLPADADVCLLDCPNVESLNKAGDNRLVLYTVPNIGAVPHQATYLLVAPEVYAAVERAVQGAVPHQATYHLAPWTRDDVIEYLLGRHKDRCASVMSRLKPADDGLLQGLPDLWAIVLEQLAGDETLRDTRQALDRYLAAHLPDTDLQERGRSVCLNALATLGEGIRRSVEELVKPGFVAGLLRVLRHRCVQVLLATERVAADLRGEADCDFLATRLPRDLIEAVAAEVAGDGRALAHLDRLLAGPPWSHAMAASLRYAADPTWVPAPGSLTALAGAYLSDVPWLGVKLPHANLCEADLSFASLGGADLTAMCADKATFRNADLHGACLEQCQASEADFRSANLTRARAQKPHFASANLEGANFDEAFLRHAVFVGARLSMATFRRTDLAWANLSDADIKGADFAGAYLVGARLAGLVLRETHFQGADFTQAVLTGCDLEGMELPAAHFIYALLDDALLTGSIMPGADFSFADLREARLAEIDWEGACLRGADLRGATFHMGSSRSGLVGSPIACEGSRTGFYTDDYDEQPFKSPEEIRKANLCRADLRGANIDDVDFYLVDLRGARLTDNQEQHARRCGAILEARV